LEGGDDGDFVFDGSTAKENGEVFLFHGFCVVVDGAVSNWLVICYSKNPALGVPTPRPPVGGRDAAPQAPLHTFTLGAELSGCIAFSRRNAAHWSSRSKLALMG
jgi:hypothetical protein